MQVPGVKYVAASILDPAAVAELPRADLAVYVAGATSNYLQDPGLTIRLGTEGVERFLGHFRTAERRLLVGSARVYGPRTSSEPLTEADACVVRSPDSRNIYDATKLITEALGRQGSTEQHPVVLTRLANVYGPYIGAATRTAFVDLVRQARAERRIQLMGPPGALRNHVYAEDLADGILRALLLGRGGEVYNLGSHDHLTNRQLAEGIAAAVGSDVSVEAANPSPPDHMVLSIAKAERELIYFPKCSARDYIAPSVQWLLRHQP